MVSANSRPFDFKFYLGGDIMMIVQFRAKKMGSERWESSSSRICWCHFIFYQLLVLPM